MKYFIRFFIATIKLITSIVSIPYGFVTYMFVVFIVFPIVYLIRYIKRGRWADTERVFTQLFNLLYYPFTYIFGKIHNLEHKYKDEYRTNSKTK